MADALRWDRLNHLGVVRFSGPDAAAFLQGQVSSDTRRLGGGQPLLGAYSTPQGRVAAILHLLPHSSGIIGILPREVVLPTVERLRRYVLRSKVAIEDLSDRFAVAGRRHAGGSADDGALPGRERRYRETGSIGTAFVGPDESRVWAVGDADALAAAGMLGDAPREREWRLADIRAGLPQVHAATREMFVAQMLNLDLIDGISFSKGCFTGQEIIARTQHLGRIKRRMFRLQLPAGNWTVGQTLTLADGRSGRLTEVAGAGAGAEALAVLPLEAGGAAADIAGSAADQDPQGVAVDAVVLPLPYALQNADPATAPGAWRPPRE